MIEIRKGDSNFFFTEQISSESRKKVNKNQIEIIFMQSSELWLMQNKSIVIVSIRARLIVRLAFIRLN